MISINIYIIHYITFLLFSCNVKNVINFTIIPEESWTTPETKQFYHLTKAVITPFPSSSSAFMLPNYSSELRFYDIANQCFFIKMTFLYIPTSDVFGVCVWSAPKFALVNGLLSLNVACHLHIFRVKLRSSIVAQNYLSGSWLEQT